MCGAEYASHITEMLPVPLLKMTLVMVIPNGSTPLDMLLTQLHSSPISQPASLLAILMLLRSLRFRSGSLHHIYVVRCGVAVFCVTYRVRRYVMT